MCALAVDEQNSLEDYSDEERHQARVEDVLDAYAEAQYTLLEEPLDMLQLLRPIQELICVLLEVIAVEAHSAARAKLFQCLQDPHAVLLDYILLLKAVMTHLQQDQLAVKDQHLTASVIFNFSIAR